jgi:hypothetical protein
MHTASPLAIDQTPNTLALYHIETKATMLDGLFRKFELSCSVEKPEEVQVRSWPQFECAPPRWCSRTSRFSHGSRDHVQYIVSHCTCSIRAGLIDKRCRPSDSLCECVLPSVVMAMYSIKSPVCHTSIAIPIQFIPSPNYSTIHAKTHHSKDAFQTFCRPGPHGISHAS